MIFNLNYEKRNQIFKKQGVGKAPCLAQPQRCQDTFLGDQQLTPLNGNPIIEIKIENPKQ